MSYEPTNWVNGETPINAENLNKIEDELLRLSESGGDIDYSEIEFDTEEIVVENSTDDDKYNLVDQTPRKTFVGQVQNLPLTHNSIEYVGYVPFPFRTKNRNYNLEVFGAIQANVGNVEPYIVSKLNDGFAFSVKKDVTYAYQKCVIAMEYRITFA